MRQAGQLITPIHEQAAFFRTIVAIVLVTFVTLNLQPLAAAAQTSAPMSPAPPAPKGLSEKLQALKETVHRAHAGITESAGGTFDLEADLDSAMAGGQLIVQEKLDDVVDEVLDQAGDIETEHDRAMAEFDEVGQWIEDEELAPVIQQRHADAVAEYQDRYATFQERIGDLSTAADGQAQQRALQGLNDFLQDQQFQRRHQPFDPDNLPFRVPDGEVREPATTREQFQELGLIQPDPIQVAAAELNPLMLAQAEDLPKPEHLEPTVDVQITQAIRDKAAELNHQPVEIYKWVRNTIEFLPTYGSIQGSDMTLLTERGNAFDTASLLIALLRASDIPARYVYGTVEIPIEQVMNWVGGVETAEAALQLLGQGGIPSTGLTSGGEFVAVRMEHVWVEAWVDFIPSRGAVNKQGDTWVPMDGSFKQHGHVPGLVDDSALGDTTDLASRFLETASTSGDGTWATGYDTSLLTVAIDDLAATLNVRLDDLHIPPESLEDVVGGFRIRPVDAAILPSSLPYLLQVKSATFDVLPSSLRAFAHIELTTASSVTLFTVQRAIPQFAYKSLSLSFRPATPEDAQTWSSYAGSSEFAPYLIKANGVLKLGAVILAETQDISLGGRLMLSVRFRGPGVQRPASFELVAGDEVQIGINASSSAVNEALTIIGRDNLNTAVGNLYATSRAFWIQADFWDRALSQLHDAQIVRLPSVGTFSSPLDVSYFFGVPFRGHYKARVVDVKLGQFAAVANDGDRRQTATVVTHSGLVLSSLEGTTPEVLFGKSIGFGANTVRLLERASEEHIPIYNIKESNGGEVLLKLEHGTEVIKDIENAVERGFEVTIPERPQQHHEWFGSGYILRDPKTGSADYRISGGASGNEQTECGRSTEPVRAEVPDVSFLAFYMLSFLVDDQGELDLAAAGALVTQGAAVGGLSALGGSALVSGAALVSRTGLVWAMNFFGMGLAVAGGEPCGCEPKPRPRRGGHVLHNMCADIYTDLDLVKKDINVSGKHFDGLRRNESTLYEIKTGTFYTKLEAANFKFAKRLQDIILVRMIGEFSHEREIATSCAYEYRFGVGDSLLADRMQERFLAVGGIEDASRVFVNGCN